MLLEVLTCISSYPSSRPSSLLSVAMLMLPPGLDSIARMGDLVIVSCSVLSMVVSSFLCTLHC